MSPREPDLRALERLLRETTPPAVVTVDFRQRVVQASLDVRLKQLSRRQTCRSALFGLIASCVLLLPFGLLATAFLSSLHAGAAPGDRTQFVISDTGHSAREAVNGTEVLAIQQQLESRLQNWLAAQRPASK